jgi:hypothetical protein
LEREGKQEDEEGRVWRKRRKEEGKVVEGAGGGKSRIKKGERKKERGKQEEFRIKDMKEKD